jgi:hypothetical protein
MNKSKLPFKTQINPLDGFRQGIVLLLDEYRKESGTNIPEQLDHLMIRDLLKSARVFIDSGLTGRLAVLFPESWGITQEVRYAVLRRVNKKDFSGDVYIDRELYTNKENPAYYGEEMECYASGETPEVILILEADEPTYAENPHLFFCNLPYDGFANEKWDENKFDTTQTKEFEKLRSGVENLIIVRTATHIDLIIADKLAGLPVEEQWLGKDKGWARSLSRKATAGGGSCVSGVGVCGGGRAGLCGCSGGAGGGCGLVLALVEKETE